jgi:hypothetical protein
MTCARNFPERYISPVVAMNPLRLLERDVVICQPVDQDNGNAASNNRVEYRGWMWRPLPGGANQFGPAVAPAEVQRLHGALFANKRSGNLDSKSIQIV